MEKKQIKALLKKYNEGMADVAEINHIEQLLQSGEIELKHLHDLSKLQDQLMHMAYPEISTVLDERFYDMLSRQKVAQKKFS